MRAGALRSRPGRRSGSHYRSRVQACDRGLRPAVRAGARRGTPAEHGHAARTVTPHDPTRPRSRAGRGRDREQHGRVRDAPRRANGDRSGARRVDRAGSQRSDAPATADPRRDRDLGAPARPARRSCRSGTGGWYGGAAGRFTRRRGHRHHPCAGGRRTGRHGSAEVRHRSSRCSYRAPGARTLVATGARALVAPRPRALGAPRTGRVRTGLVHGPDAGHLGIPRARDVHAPAAGHDRATGTGTVAGAGHLAPAGGAGTAAVTP